MIEIDFTTRSIATALSRAATELGDLSELMDLLGMEMVFRTGQNFRDGTAPDGTPWAPRSATTLAAYGRAKPPKVPKGGPLVLHGFLSQSISHEQAPAHVDWGSNALQAAVMQFGASQGQFGARIGKDKNGRDHFMTIPWGDIPARPYLGVGPDDETVLTETIEKWLETLLTE